MPPPAKITTNGDRVASVRSACLTLDSDGLLGWHREQDAAGLDAQLDQWLDRLLSNGPIAMSLTKGLLGTMHQDMRYAHASAAAQAAATEDCNEGVRAFAEKRKPVYTNR